MANTKKSGTKKRASTKGNVVRIKKAGARKKAA